MVWMHVQQYRQPRTSSLMLLHKCGTRFIISLDGGGHIEKYIVCSYRTYVLLGVKCSKFYKVQPTSVVGYGVL